MYVNLYYINVNKLRYLNVYNILYRLKIYIHIEIESKAPDKSLYNLVLWVA